MRVYIVNVSEGTWASEASEIKGCFSTFEKARESLIYFGLDLTDQDIDEYELDKRPDEAFESLFGFQIDMASEEGLEFKMNGRPSEHIRSCMSYDSSHAIGIDRSPELAKKRAWEMASLYKQK